MKLVINRCYGGFSLSHSAAQMLADIKKCPLDQHPSDRADPLLVQVVEQKGKRANGAFAELKVVEIPNGIEWEINDYDGMETIHEKHRSWC